MGAAVQGEARENAMTSNEEIMDELKDIRDELSRRADDIDSLRAEDAEMRDHISRLDLALRDVRTDIQLLTQQSARTEGSLAAFREVQVEQHKSVLSAIEGLRDDIKETMMAALKSTPKSVKLVISILGLIATFLLVAATLHASPGNLP